ncbi:hypothetical protein WICPIJ_008191 [Wickerhamomyces pijperi]|uniref:Uncharacterized protein n=1 Tax=Wickerhamomyces pijperi TaxID=599730 RepID=A0A9P8PZU9_WICPI|nr:hypothetical protein WICPIJ_008191 [Wickerhamomyces pijperi]
MYLSMNHIFSRPTPGLVPQRHTQLDSASVYDVFYSKRDLPTSLEDLKRELERYCDGPAVLDEYQLVVPKYATYTRPGEHYGHQTFKERQTKFEPSLSSLMSFFVNNKESSSRFVSERQHINGYFQTQPRAADGAVSIALVKEIASERLLMEKEWRDGFSPAMLRSRKFGWDLIVDAPEEPTVFNIHCKLHIID